MRLTPPSLHFPSPYARPSTAPTLARSIERPDGARIAAFVYGSLDSAELPVLFLHGNGEEHGLFGPTIDEVVASGRAAIGVDSRAQGRSTRGTERLTYELMAEDALTVLDALGVQRAHVVGFSDGGIEGILLARDHSERVTTLLAIGANLTPEGVIDDPEWDIVGSLAACRTWEQASFPLEVDTALLSPTPAEAQVTADLLQLMLDEPHIPAASLSAISCPTTVMVGEFDCITEEETLAIYRGIAGARLVVVPECEHVIPKHDPDAVTRELFTLLDASTGDEWCESLRR